jgi:hypothetical protein
LVFFQFATEAIDSIRTVVGLHREEFFISEYEECFNQDFKYEMRIFSLKKRLNLFIDDR